MFSGVQCDHMFSGVHRLFCIILSCLEKVVNKMYSQLRQDLCNFMQIFMLALKTEFRGINFYRVSSKKQTFFGTRGYSPLSQ
jgi:hypothetical protein